MRKREKETERKKEKDRDSYHKDFLVVYFGFFIIPFSRSIFIVRGGFAKMRGGDG